MLTDVADLLTRLSVTSLASKEVPASGDDCFVVVVVKVVAVIVVVKKLGLNFK